MEASTISFENRYAQSILVFLIALVLFILLDYVFQTNMGILPALAGSLAAAVVTFILRTKDESH